MPGTFATDALPDPAGGLWVTTRYAGLFHLAHVGVRVLTTQDGLLAGQTTGGFQPSACKTPDGNLWFVTPQGLARIDPATVRRPPSQPRVVLGSLRVGDRTYRLLDASRSKLVGDEVKSPTSLAAAAKRSPTRLRGHLWHK